MGDRGPAVPEVRLPEQELMTPAEVARAFRVSPKTVNRWVKTGRLRRITTLGGHSRIYRSDVEDALRSGRLGG